MLALRHVDRFTDVDLLEHGGRHIVGYSDPIMAHHVLHTLGSVLQGTLLYLYNYRVFGLKGTSVRLTFCEGLPTVLFRSYQLPLETVVARYHLQSFRLDVL